MTHAQTMKRTHLCMHVLYVIMIIVSKMMSHCMDTVQMREDQEAGQEERRDVV